MNESDLLNHRAAILEQGEAIRAERQHEAEQEAAARAQAMWRMSRAGSWSSRRVSPW